MRRARFIHNHLDASRKATTEANAALHDPSLTPEHRAVLQALADGQRHLEEATRALYEEVKEHDHPQPRYGQGIVR